MLRILNVLLVSVLAVSTACMASPQAIFEGVYKVGGTSFRVEPVPEGDQHCPTECEQRYRVIYANGNKTGTLVKLAQARSDEPGGDFDFIFFEYMGAQKIGAFYFTESWKGAPISGYYVKVGSNRQIPVEMIGYCEGKAKKSPSCVQR